jgi:hypothetical protein
MRRSPSTSPKSALEHSSSSTVECAAVLRAASLSSGDP